MRHCIFYSHEMSRWRWIHKAAALFHWDELSGGRSWNWFNEERHGIILSARSVTNNFKDYVLGFLHKLVWVKLKEVWFTGIVHVEVIYETFLTIVLMLLYLIIYYFDLRITPYRIWSFDISCFYVGVNCFKLLNLIHGMLVIRIGLAMLWGSLIYRTSRT